MKVGDITRTVISTSKKLRGESEVVYKTYLGQHKGKARYSSKTKHEKVKANL